MLLEISSSLSIDISQEAGSHSPVWSTTAGMWNQPDIYGLQSKLTRRKITIHVLELENLTGVCPRSYWAETSATSAKTLTPNNQLSDSISLVKIWHESGLPNKLISSFISTTRPSVWRQLHLSPPPRRETRQRRHQECHWSAHRKTDELIDGPGR